MIGEAAWLCVCAGVMQDHTILTILLTSHSNTCHGLSVMLSVLFVLISWVQKSVWPMSKFFTRFLASVQVAKCQSIRVFPPFVEFLSFHLYLAYPTRAQSLILWLPWQETSEIFHHLHHTHKCFWDSHCRSITRGLSGVPYSLASNKCTTKGDILRLGLYKFHGLFTCVL